MIFRGEKNNLFFFFFFLLIIHKLIDKDVWGLAALKITMAFFKKKKKAIILLLHEN